MNTIAVLGTFDTKGDEHAFLARCIREAGCDVLLIDVGTGDAPRLQPDISRFDVANASGLNLQPILDRHDRGEAVTAMARAVPICVENLRLTGRIHGIISLGGGGGTAIASSAMRALPIGFPKLIVSTLASGNIAHYVGTKDIVMMPSVVDINGLNRVAKLILSRAAGAIVGMVRANVNTDSEKPIIVASMFGNTTACINAAIPIFTAAGFETIVFAATGSGGRAMESLIDSGMVAGVFDITTTELADELVGGVLSAGPDRLNAAARVGVPAVVAPGCLDMVNFGEPTSVPQHFQKRTFYQHNPQVTLMRTTPDECRRLGENLARSVNQYTAPTTVLIPTRAISIISASGEPFHDPMADRALFESIQNHLEPHIHVKVLDLTINDPAFARIAAETLLTNIREHAMSRTRHETMRGPTARPFT